MVNLLLKGVWSNEDIMRYVGCSKTKASELHQEASIKHGGYIPHLPKKVKRDAVLEVLGLDILKEIQIAKEINDD